MENLPAVEDEMQSSRSRYTKEGRRITYKMKVIQQPERARACGQGAKSSTDRRPVDPPPIIDLHIFEGDEGNMTDITFNYNANFFLFATLENARPIAHGRVPQPQTNSPILTGSPVAGMSYLDRPHPAGYFIFPDLSVRHEGKYRLVFNLYEELKNPKDEDSITKPLENPGTGGSVGARCPIKSAPFTVYSAKKFPGLAESTVLSRMVADQGCRVRIRRDVRMRRRDTKSSKEWDDDGDRGTPSSSQRPSIPEIPKQELPEAKPLQPADPRNTSAAAPNGHPHQQPPTATHSQPSPHQYPPRYPHNPMQPQATTAAYPAYANPAYANPPIPQYSAQSAPQPQPAPAYYGYQQYSYPPQPQPSYPYQQGFGYPPPQQIPAQPPPQEQQQAPPSRQNSNEYPQAQQPQQPPQQQFGYQQPAYPPQYTTPSGPVPPTQPSYASQAPYNQSMYQVTNGSNQASGKGYPMAQPQDGQGARYDVPSTAQSSPSMYTSANGSYVPPYVTPGAAPSAQKRPFGAAFETTHTEVPLRAGQRPIANGMGPQPGVMMHSAGSVDSDFDLASEKLKMTYRRADGTEVSRRWPQ